VDLAEQASPGSKTKACIQGLPRNLGEPRHLHWNRTARGPEELRAGKGVSPQARIAKW